MRLQKVGIVLSVVILSAISFISGVNINNQANSTASSSVLPIVKGGTGANNAATARTNLGISSTTDMNTAISYASDMKGEYPYLWDGASGNTYSKMFDNVTTTAEYRATYIFSALFNRNYTMSGGTIYINTNRSNATNQEIQSAYWCPSASRANAWDFVYYALVDNGNGTFSIWQKFVHPLWSSYFASKKAQVYIAKNLSISQREVLLNNTSRTEPEGITEKGWIPLQVSCASPPSPTATPSSTSSP
jgi:hypothetical protein